jgi:membrane-associated phospholipid phosphatase
MKKSLFVCGMLLAGSAHASNESVEKAGDLLQIAIPLSAYGATFYLGDSEGRAQFHWSFLTTLGVTQGLKYSIDAERPNGGKRAFPSGHTSAAFQGAAFVHMRYGLSYGLPAYALASFVGYSRVASDQHHPRDVYAGAAIGTLASVYFTSRYVDARTTAVVPIIDGRHHGLMVHKRF